MASRERLIHRGDRLAHAALLRIGEELRQARRDRGLSIDAVATALGISNAHVSRIERGLAPNVSFVTLARFASVVGLDLVAKLYPGATPLRDGAQNDLLSDLRFQLHPSLRWAVEVWLPIPGDQRAWDAMISGAGWRIGVEAESSPRDAQALLRRVHLKARDGEVDAVLLALRDTHSVRQFLMEADEALRASFPVGTREALKALRAGVCPAGNALVIVPRRRARSTRHTREV